MDSYGGVGDDMEKKKKREGNLRMWTGSPTRTYPSCHGKLALSDMKNGNTLFSA